MSQTIFALSSGGLPSGVAIIRLSGPHTLQTIEKIAGKVSRSREALLRDFINPDTEEVLDRGLVILFQKPASFTGEDVAELHCHGGVATVDAILDCLSGMPGLRMAEAGEFSRRAFENGRLDLTGLEGLADLISAQTEEQRKQALSQSSGSLRTLYEGWREELIRYRALIEAELDFADEDGVPGSVSEQVWQSVQRLLSAVDQHLDDQRRGEVIRDGFKIALIGPPNAGKSSLLNALAKRDVAIVTPEAGTTRDVVSVSLDLDGQLVIVSDTAGLRDTDSMVEQEGIRRAKKTAEDADLVLWLQPADDPKPADMAEGAVLVRTKSDLRPDGINQSLTINTIMEEGLEPLLTFLSTRLKTIRKPSEQPLLTRHRHRLALNEVRDSLSNAARSENPIEMRSEDLRLASHSLGKLTGQVDVEELLDVIFSEFCIGK